MGSPVKERRGWPLDVVGERSIEGITLDETPSGKTHK
jgi:hypothetical protein